MNCRVVVAQTNLADHLERIDRARKGGADLIVFPELSLTGYFLKDQVYDLGLDPEADPIAALVDASKHISIAFGFVERTAEGRLYNTFAFLEQGAILGLHRKVHLVSYGLFDEERDFAAGDRFELIESRLGRFGPLLCEDMWHTPSAYLHFLADADALLIASASPARGVEAPGPGLGSQRAWDLILRASALLYRTWVVYAGRVGWEDGIGFGGTSGIYDPFGNPVARLEGLEPGEIEGELTSAALHRARVETPLRRDEKPWVLAAGLGAHLPSSAAGCQGGSAS